MIVSKTHSTAEEEEQQQQKESFIYSRAMNSVNT